MLPWIIHKWFKQEIKSPNAFKIVPLPVCGSGGVMLAPWQEELEAHWKSWESDAIVTPSQHLFLYGVPWQLDVTADKKKGRERAWQQSAWQLS